MLRAIRPDLCLGDVRLGVVRRLPYAPPVLGRGGAGAAGVPDVPHGDRPPAMGDVLVVQARRATPPEAERHAAGRSRGAHLPDVPHAPRRTARSAPPGGSWPCACPWRRIRRGAADQTTILQALDVLDPEGNPTPRLEVVEQADVARLTQENWQRERDRMITVCEECHSGNFVRAELEKGDDTVREADRVPNAEDVARQLDRRGRPGWPVRAPRRHVRGSVSTGPRSP